MKVVHKFEKMKDYKGIQTDTILFHIGYLKGHPEERCMGALVRLFGAPSVTTNDVADMFRYDIEAVSETGEESILSVFTSKQGPVIAGQFGTDAEKRAAEELLYEIKSVAPADFDYFGNCYKIGLQIECGIRDGRIYYLEHELDEQQGA